MARPTLDNRLFLLGFCITACGTEPPEGSPFTTGSTDNDDDEDSTSTGDPSPTVSASASGSASASATSPSTTDTPTSGETDSTTTGPDETTMMIDPTTGDTNPPTTTEPPMTSSSSSGEPETSSTTSDGTTTTETTTGESTTTGGGDGIPACENEYADAYELCYPGYYYSAAYCNYYAEGCLGISDECDALLDEWIVCATEIACGDWTFPPCEAELTDLQTTCDCGNSF